MHPEAGAAWTGRRDLTPSVDETSGRLWRFGVRIVTGLGHGYYNGQLKVSVAQFVASKLVSAGINRPVSSLVLGANTNFGGAASVFYGGAANGGNNLPTIGSPMSAFTTVFGGALPGGTTASSLLKRRKSILDLVRTEATALKTSLGTTERAKLDLHLESVRQLENKRCSRRTRPRRRRA